MAATLKQLEGFVALAQTGNFSAAARLMHISQPALTAMIKKLEDQLSVSLFDRTSRGASITTAGRELLPTIDRLVSELNETLTDVLSGTSPRGGTVTIACIASAAAVHLPGLIAGFHRSSPATRVIVKDAIPENREIVGMLRAEQVDVGIASPLEDAPELQFRRLYDDELVAVVAAKHPIARADSISWTALAALPLIGLAYQSYVRLMIDKTFALIGVSKRPLTEVSLTPTAVGMARAGLGVAVIASTAATTCNLTGLKQLAIVEPTVRRPVGLLYRSLASLPPAARAFVEFATARRRGGV